MTDLLSGGTNFKPTIMSPLYDAKSSKGSVYKKKQPSIIQKRDNKGEPNSQIKEYRMPALKDK